jgi:hypothetical protein
VVGDPPAWPEPWCDDRYLQCLPARALQPRRDAAELAWMPVWDEVAIRLYTSGSTGAPQAQPKTLGQLVLGARALVARLAEDIEGGVATLDRIVCSVPPQHMFGLECSVMLPLVCGLPVLDRRPLLPADVHAAFEGGPAALWVAHADAPAQPRPGRRGGARVRAGDRLDDAARTRDCPRRRTLPRRAGARDLRLHRDRRAGDAAHLAGGRVAPARRRAA